MCRHQVEHLAEVKPPGLRVRRLLLPKDVRALLYRAREADTDLPMMQSVLTSNGAPDRACRRDGSRPEKRRIGVLGISFKAGTDDLRESPLVLLTETLIGKGLDVRIFDSEVSMARLVGANKEYIEREIPHIALLLVDDLAAVSAHAEVLIVGNASPSFQRLPEHCRPGQTIIDLVGVDGLSGCEGVDYRGVTW